MTDSVAQQVSTTERLTEREDFRATGDPALEGFECAGRRWSCSTIASCTRCGSASTGRCRISTSPRIASTGTSGSTPEERYQRMYGLSAFFVGEQRVAAELGPMMRACPDEDMRIFLCTQIADEARHVAFFDRFYAEVGVLEADDLEGRLAETSEHLNPEFGVLFDELLRGRVDRLARRARGHSRRWSRRSRSTTW